MRKCLIELRKKNNLTQQQVADELRISRAFYAMIESGKRNPTLELAKQVSEYFNSDLESIFFENECHKKEQQSKPA